MVMTARPRPRQAKRLRQLLLAVAGVVAGVVLFVRVFAGNGSIQEDRALPKKPQTPPTPRLRTTQSSHDQCRFYLAESAIPMSGLALFTVVDIDEGETSQANIDICVYVADTPKRTHFTTHSWSRDTFFAEFEGENPRGACEGFGTLVNSMPPGRQTSRLTLLGVPHHNAGLRRDQHAGAGAISHYYGLSSVATRKVLAGSEVTIDYGDWHYSDSELQATWLPERSVDYIKQNGLCVDNIHVATATDPSMGRGAFSKYNLKAGSIVAPAPLQVFPNRMLFEAQTPSALFINYVLEVDDGMILFPYGPGVNLINHSQKPNVAWRWSEHHMHHANWLELSKGQFLQFDYPGGIMLEVVALRDITAGEELFLDYGQAWQEAGAHHVRNWKPDLAPYTYPQDMDRTLPFRTLEEQENDPYPSNLQTVCWTDNSRRHGKDDKAEAKSTQMPWKSPDPDNWPERTYECKILKRKEKAGSHKYDVGLILSEDQEADDLHIDTGVPQDVIYFVDQMYKSDMHLPKSFRHAMVLPDELVPKTWRRST